jgi:hypothetical protein
MQRFVFLPDHSFDRMLRLCDEIMPPGPVAGCPLVKKKQGWIDIRPGLIMTQLKLLACVCYAVF